MDFSAPRAENLTRNLEAAIKFMCGIVGVLSDKDAVDRLLDGLSRLEYRGYDSSGVATVSNGAVNRRRAAGKLEALRAEIAARPIHGNVGIGHTRWATHGAPEKRNAHPHVTRNLALVHNGIIENYRELKDELMAAGAIFTSDTDTEAIALLLDAELEKKLPPLTAVRNVLGKLRGAFALAMIFKDYPDLMIGARRGSPLVVGVGKNDLFLGSDAWALAPWTNQVRYPEEGDLVVLEKNGKNYVSAIYDAGGTLVERPVKTVDLTAATVDKGAYGHYMLKEIFEQPRTLNDTLLSTLDEKELEFGDFAAIDFKTVARLRLIACGSSYYAALLGKYLIEKYARIACEVDLASEFRYRDPVLGKNELCVFVSQSGETSDTLAALNLAKAMGNSTLAVVNVPESSMARAADRTVITKAGLEIGVASTKAFTAQMAVLSVLALKAASDMETLDRKTLKGLLRDLSNVPIAVERVLAKASVFEAIGSFLAKASDVLFIGRGVNFPIALEGALKLKEISYIHAEAYAAGELKHGPIALVDEKTPLIAIAPNDAWFEKTVSNIQEVAARGAPIVVLTDRDFTLELKGDHRITVLESSSTMANPFVFAVAVQCLAYYTAVRKGTDVDKPRNLAKSVTVE